MRTKSREGKRRKKKEERKKEERRKKERRKKRRGGGKGATAKAKQSTHLIWGQVTYR